MKWGSVLIVVFLLHYTDQAALATVDLQPNDQVANTRSGAPFTGDLQPIFEPELKWSSKEGLYLDYAGEPTWETSWHEVIDGQSDDRSDVSMGGREVPLDWSNATTGSNKQNANAPSFEFARVPVMRQPPPARQPAAVGPKVGMVLRLLASTIMAFLILVRITRVFTSRLFPPSDEYDPCDYER